MRKRMRSARARSKRLPARVCIQWLAVRASASITFRGRIFPGTHTRMFARSTAKQTKRISHPPNILFQYACAFSARMTHMRERGIDLHNISVGARKTQINESRWSAPCTSYRSCKCTTILNYSALKRLFPRCIRWTFHMHAYRYAPSPGSRSGTPAFISSSRPEESMCPMSMCAGPDGFGFCSCICAHWGDAVLLAFAPPTNKTGNDNDNNDQPHQ